MPTHDLPKRHVGRSPPQTSPCTESAPSRPPDPTDWRAALAAWERERAEAEAAARARQPLLAGQVPVGWWIEAFPNPPTVSEERGHPCGERQMLIIVAYDISDPRRLSRVARWCEDHGLRVQLSVFECRMEAEAFARFWSGLIDLIDPEEDRLVAYRVCAECAQRIQVAGLMETSHPHVAYVY